MKGDDDMKDRRRSPELLRFLGRHLAIGAGAAVVFVAALIGGDIAGFRTLMIASGAPVLAGIMLIAVLVITWGSTAMGIAVFLLPRDDPPPKRRRPARAPHAALAPATVKSSRR
jgi:hypothetical protein